MALTYGFYNSVEGDRKYDAIQMGQIFDGIITDGIYATFLKAMVVKASENASEVIVQPGRCWFNHTWTYIDADYPVEAPAPEVILDRVDALVLDINSENAFRANSLVWVQGTPSSLNPERPALIKSVTHNQYPLCYVYRKAGTTMIYAADITNTVGTSETPFVTGVLTGINIDDLLAQWDDEFHTWEATTKTSFEAWMVNQQSVYITWFDSIKDQMEGDLTDFEAWFETIRGIIDEEAATHLQAEIDELKDMLPAGSHIDISTSESTLFNRNVTVSDGVHSKTVQFDASGAATVESFPYIGIISVTSTDGTRTAEESINIPYFGRYSAVLAFWSATVNLVGDEPLAAIPVTVRDGNGDVVAVVTLNASGQGVFTATKPDEYKFIYTYGGQTMEVSLAVTQETTYEVELHGGFRFDIWLEAGRVSETFDTLDEVLADEPTLRQLFLVHDSVDYICNTFSESATSALADITKIFNTDLAAKWINLSDYALDHFYAVEGIKSIMDTADKYGYGEWALMPQVPTMTSNTAPYGEVIYSSAQTDSSGTKKTYGAFDGSDSTSWGSTSTTGEAWVGYAFVNAIAINKVHVRIGVPSSDSTTGATDVTIDVSDDGTNWTTLQSVSDMLTSTFADYNFDIQNSESHRYWRLHTANANNRMWIKTLQFYAWAPKGNVPVMTSNTTPYGKCAMTGTDASGHEAYHVFDGKTNTSASTSGTVVGGRLYYMFPNPVNVRRVFFAIQTDGGITKNIIWRYSDDGTTWSDALSETITQTAGYFMHYADIPDCGYHLYWAFYIASSSGAVTTYAYQLQFYGRELKVSVPTMTSNTAPYGEVFGNVYNYQTNMYVATYDNAFLAGSRNEGYTNISTLYIGYKFTEKIKPILAQIRTGSDSNGLHLNGFVVEASNDRNTWDQISSGTMSSTSYVMNVNADETYLYLRVRPTNEIASPSAYPQIGFQFYGLDYSEKEFEAGTTKKWLYDHGVELVELEAYKGSTTTSPIYMNDRNELYIQNLVGTDSNYSNYRVVGKTIDLSNYSLFRAKIGSRLGFAVLSNVSYSNSLVAWKTSGIPTSGTYNSSNYDAISYVTLPITGTNYVLNVSSINESKWVAVFVSYQNGRGTSITELWLE